MRAIAAGVTAALIAFSGGGPAIGAESSWPLWSISWEGGTLSAFDVAADPVSQRAVGDGFDDRPTGAAYDPVRDTAWVLAGDPNLIPDAPSDPSAEEQPAEARPCELAPADLAAGGPGDGVREIVFASPTATTYCAGLDVDDDGEALLLARGTSDVAADAWALYGLELGGDGDIGTDLLGPIETGDLGSDYWLESLATGVDGDRLVVGQDGAVFRLAEGAGGFVLEAVSDGALPEADGEPRWSWAADVDAEGVVWLDAWTDAGAAELWSFDPASGAFELRAEPDGEIGALFFAPPADDAEDATPAAAWWMSPWLWAAVLVLLAAIAGLVVALLVRRRRAG